jgi:putative hydrolase of the HAD superfamily
MNPVWLFDLDNTLHDAGKHIFPHINNAMSAYLAKRLGLGLDEASALRWHYWKRYGATLHGMVRHHGTRPAEFLAATHCFDNLRSMVVFDHALLQHLRRLPGRKYIFSNAPRSYLDEIMRITGLNRVMDGSFSVEDLRFQPKPRIRGYQTVLRCLHARATDCVMIEDTAHNLRPAKRLGMRTVWITPNPQPKPVWVDRQLRSVRALRAW